MTDADIPSGGPYEYGSGSVEGGPEDLAGQALFELIRNSVEEERPLVLTPSEGSEPPEISLGNRIGRLFERLGDHGKQVRCLVEWNDQDTLQATFGLRDDTDPFRPSLPPDVEA